MSSPNSREFERAATQKRKSFIAEFAGFLMENKRWWMTPIIVVLLLVSALLVAGGSGLAPFIYTLF